MELDLHLLLLGITAWAELSRKGIPKVSGTWGPVKDPKSQQDLKQVQNYAFANPTAKFRTCSSLKENIYKQHSSREKETENFG